MIWFLEFFPDSESYWGSDFKYRLVCALELGCCCRCRVLLLPTNFFCYLGSTPA